MHTCRFCLCGIICVCIHVGIVESLSLSFEMPFVCGNLFLLWGDIIKKLNINRESF